MIISSSNLQQAKNQIKKSSPPVVILARGYEFNRKIAEYGKFQVLLSPERLAAKDRSKQLDSGMNLILAKILAKNKIAVGIDFNSLTKIANKKQKAQRIARIKQNIKLCRKAKCRISLLNYKNEKNAKAFLLSLGAGTKQTILF